jgi:transposase
MSVLWKAGIKIFVFNEAIDMRSGFSRLHALVVDKMKGDIFEGHLFLFLGKNRRRAKMLRFDGT